MGGTMSLQSLLGAGTSLQVDLPLDGAAAESQPLPSGQPEPLAS